KALFAAIENHAIKVDTAIENNNEISAHRGVNLLDILTAPIKISRKSLFNIFDVVQTNDQNNQIAPAVKAEMNVAETKVAEAISVEANSAIAEVNTAVSEISDAIADANNAIAQENLAVTETETENDNIPSIMPVQDVILNETKDVTNPVMVA